MTKKCSKCGGEMKLEEKRNPSGLGRRASNHKTKVWVCMNCENEELSKEI